MVKNCTLVRLGWVELVGCACLDEIGFGWMSRVWRCCLGFDSIGFSFGLVECGWV